MGLGAALVRQEAGKPAKVQAERAKVSPVPQHAEIWLTEILRCMAVWPSLALTHL